MMLGSDREATVDGIHFTDVGMMRYADLVTPVIKKLLKNSGFMAHSLLTLSDNELVMRIIMILASKL